ncbi:MAG: 4-(cytidine 5'-diphospho)-2-C-methyl-D-erythritol kinase [Planctomycetes bacterium]|nr:4-(cytidine 5'-diphospho)-2-C-methyl-D-erythritol kinase [Planctomycetota bacterium]
MLTLKSPAKINWFLEVMGKRPDGYHELVTVMQTVSLYDTLDFEDLPRPFIEFRCDLDLGPPEKNLVVRAAQAVQKTYAEKRGARITLNKKIPHGAGLGGGSSDAATTVVGLNQLWNLNLSTEQLEQVVRSVGSDCAFFVRGGTALCTGRGEIVEPKPLISGIDLVILYPEIVLPTPDVYRKLSENLQFERRKCNFFHRDALSLDATKVATKVFNRLEHVALRVSPKLSDVWQRTADEKAVTKRFVSGSGSSLVFVVPDESAARALAQSFEKRSLGRAFVAKSVAGR